MDIQARIEELTHQAANLERQRQGLIRQQQEDAVNVQRIAGAIAILTELLGNEETPAEASPNGKVKEEVKA